MRAAFAKTVSGGYSQAELSRTTGGTNAKGLEPSNMKNVQSISHPDTGSGYTVAGLKDQKGRPAVFSQKAAAAFGRMISDSKGVVKGSDIASSQRSRQKNAAVGGDPNSNHLYGNALDIHGSSQTWMRRNGKKYGWIVNDYAGSHGGHFDFSAYAKGGRTLPYEHYARIGEEGTEYVIDNKSFETTEKFLPGLLDILNYKVNDKASLIKYLPNIISSLSQYTYYGNPNQEPQYIIIKSLPEIVYVPTGSSGRNVFISGGVNNNNGMEATLTQVG
jgi:hypothetical protein